MGADAKPRSGSMVVSVRSSDKVDAPRDNLQPVEYRETTVATWHVVGGTKMWERGRGEAGEGGRTIRLDVEGKKRGVQK